MGITGSTAQGLQTQSALAISQGRAPESESPLILVATADSSLRESLKEVPLGELARVEYVSGARQAIERLQTGCVAACLCGFRLEDGTFREVVKEAKRQEIEVPIIIVSTPHCPNEYREYLAAMNAGAFDFLCHPYQKREVHRILDLAFASRRRSLANRYL